MWGGLPPDTISGRSLGSNVSLNVSPVTLFQKIGMYGKSHANEHEGFPFKNIIKMNH